MRITILGSGSEGNALLLESQGASVLVDAGLSHRGLVRRFAAIGREPPTHISGLIVTHSHGDHAAHASTYATRLGCPIRASTATLGSLRLRPSVEARAFTVGRRFQIGDINIHTRSIPHDAAQVALVFETPTTMVGLVTDLGHVPKGIGSFLSGCETLLLESNHDPDMLRTGPYPMVVKRRVASSVGHLSNEQAGELLAGLRKTPRHVVLMHLSETNNTPALARNVGRQALGSRKETQLLVAPQRKPLELALAGPRQLRLGL